MAGRIVSLLAFCFGSLACGGGGGPTGSSPEVAPVDVSQSPAALTMTCDGGASLSVAMPCLIGLNLAGQDPDTAGTHATECRLATSDKPLVWSFLFPLAAVRADPATSLHAPADMPTAGAAQAIQLNGESASISNITGDLTFTRVDPTARAFSGAFKGTIVWTSSSSTQTTCQIDGPFWGAPGNFL
jgi:hypothetical protein